jgi:hypothetical protein
MKGKEFLWMSLAIGSGYVLGVLLTPWVMKVVPSKLRG